MNSGLTAQELRERLSYDPETGVFVRRIPRGPWRAGEVAGTKHSRGYWVIGLDGRNYKAHRLAWLYVYGEWPHGELDHINLDKRDNRIANLRIVTRSENTMNRARARCDSRLGLLGVTQIGNGYIARITVQGVSEYLGIYPTPQEASAAYMARKQEITT